MICFINQFISKLMFYAAVKFIIVLIRLCQFYICVLSFFKINNAATLNAKTSPKVLHADIISSFRSLSWAQGKVFLLEYLQIWHFVLVYFESFLTLVAEGLECCWDWFAVTCCETQVLILKLACFYGKFDWTNTARILSC